jgi:hypothetical protein
MGRYDHPEVLLTLFRSTFNVYAVESQIRKGGIKRTATSVAVSSFELNQRVLLASGLDSLFIEQTRP